MHSAGGLRCANPPYGSEFLETMGFAKTLYPSYNPVPKSS